MRIAIDGLHLFGNYAGIQGSLASLVTSLRKFVPQDEIVLFTPRDFIGPPFSVDDPGLRIRRAFFKGKSRGVRTLWRNFRLQGRAYKEKCDLLHGPTYALPYLLSLPSVATIHDVIALTHPLFCTPGSAKIQKRAIPRAAKIARRVIVPSLATKESLLATVKEADEKKIDVVPWGVGEEFKPISDQKMRRDAREFLKLPEKYVLYVGNIEPKKNLPLLINSFFAAKMNKKLPHKLIIAGQIGWGKQNIERLVVNLNARDFILFTGYVEPRALPVIYALADLFVMPSIVEGFGMPALEAMACGCPVVTSIDPALREVCGSAARVFQYDANKPYQPLREVFEELLTNGRDELEKMRATGLERAKIFTWERTARLTHETYTKALG
jgi:glycosyltransferase involved in cell wall biosynthesis